MSSPTELSSLEAFWLNQYDPTLLNIWSISFYTTQNASRLIPEGYLSLSLPFAERKRENADDGGGQILPASSLGLFRHSRELFIPIVHLFLYLFSIFFLE